MKTIGIIGGGFSGTMTAVHLVRLARQPLRVCLINSGYPLGRGVAYGTRRGEHLLNVAARNMSALADQPNHFVEWLGTRSEYADVPTAHLREQFLPRRVYGDYLQGVLLWHMQNAGAAKACIEPIDDEVLDIVPGGERPTLAMKGRRTLEVDSIVLATGNQAPADTCLPVRDFEHPRWLNNPWLGSEKRLTDPREPVVLLGAGLTMIDVFLTLQALSWQGAIHAVSRTGLLPLSHFRGIDYPDFPGDDPSSLSLDALAALMEEHCGRLRRRGENPAIVVDRLRPYTQRIWQKLSLEEKRRFGRDYRTRWNVTRHRIAPTIHEQMTAALAAGALRIVRGNVIEVAGGGEGLRIAVDMSPPDSGRATLDTGWLINCTGPQENYRKSNSILFQNLFDRGLVQADDLDMGIKTGPDFSVLDGGGYALGYLHAMGPLLKGSLWETTAVPELRNQALRLAEILLAKCEGSSSDEWFAEMFVDVLEYSI